MNKKLIVDGDKQSRPFCCQRAQDLLIELSDITGLMILFIDTRGSYPNQEKLGQVLDLGLHSRNVNMTIVPKVHFCVSIEALAI